MHFSPANDWTPPNVDLKVGATTKFPAAGLGIHPFCNFESEILTRISGLAQRLVFGLCDFPKGRVCGGENASFQGTADATGQAPAPAANDPNRGYRLEEIGPGHRWARPQRRMKYLNESFRLAAVRASKCLRTSDM